MKYSRQLVRPKLPKKSKYMKGLQKRNIGSHHLGSRGYGGKRSKWAMEDAEAASLGIIDFELSFITSSANLPKSS